MKRPLALITGSAVRVGRGIALHLARQGWEIVIHGKPDARLKAEETAQACREIGGAARIALADLSTRSGCEELFATLEHQEPLDLLVNNVGIYRIGPLRSYSPADWDATMRTNLDAVFHCSQLALPHLRHGSSIVNLGYVGVDHVTGSRKTAAYSVSKLGALSLTRSLALELASEGIRVNMVSPGELDNSVEFSAERVARIPMGYAGTVEDIARTVAWLASPEAHYVTGQNLDVAGGLMLALRGE